MQSPPQPFVRGDLRRGTTVPSLLPRPSDVRSRFLVPSETTALQRDAEDEVAPYYVDLSKLAAESAKQLVDAGLMNPDTKEVKLLRDKHVEYLLTGLGTLSGSYASLDASRPWIAYWCLHSLDLLDSLPLSLLPSVVSTLSTFQNPDGGFGGGPMQLSHGAPTYASCLALLLIGPDCPSAYAAINRPKLYQWFLRMKTPQGGFRMHDDGEADVRGTYTVIAVASLLNLVTPELSAGVADYAAACQTYEGGFGGEPGNEAHGGYAFCAVAALQLLGEMDRVDVARLKGWLARRQMAMEGGFQGRTNKLVDGCYSFWQGGAMAVVDMAEGGLSGLDSGVTERVAELSAEGGGGVDLDSIKASLPCPPDAGNLSFDQCALQRYVLLCGQHVNGGLRDKPSKPRDYYHTCYNLSGLAVAQHAMASDGVPVVVGDGSSNVLQPTHPCINIRADRVEKAREMFKDALCDHNELMRI